MFSNRDARPITVRCGFGFRELELGESLAWCHAAGFKGAQAPNGEKSGELFAPGQSEFRCVKSHKVWRTIRRGSEADLIRVVGCLECGAEALVRLSPGRSGGQASGNQQQGFAPNAASTEHDPHLTSQTGLVDSKACACTPVMSSTHTISEEAGEPR